MLLIKYQQNVVELVKGLLRRNCLSLILEIGFGLNQGGFSESTIGTMTSNLLNCIGLFIINIFK